MNGIEFLDLVKAREGRHIRGIVLTGDTSPHFVDMAFRSGWPVLFKPIDTNSLRLCIESVLTEHGAEVASITVADPEPNLRHQPAH